MQASNSHALAPVKARQYFRQTTYFTLHPGHMSDYLSLVRDILLYKRAN